MKRRLLLLLVAVFLLRGWVGEAMAAQMMAHQLQAAATGAVQQLDGQAHDADCDQAVAGVAGDKGSGCGSCTDCQDCSLHALPGLAAHVAHALPHAPTAALVHTFASAELLQGLKPPIA